MNIVIEILLVIAIAVVLCLIFGISPALIIFWGKVVILFGIEIVLLFMFAVFAYCAFRLITSKAKDAEFTEIKKDEHRLFPTAHYLVDGTEYPCLFPSELGKQDFMYRKWSGGKVMLNRKKGYVFDRFSTLATIIGFFYCLITIPIIGLMIYVVFTTR